MAEISSVVCFPARSPQKDIQTDVDSPLETISGIGLSDTVRNTVSGVVEASDNNGDMVELFFGYRSV